jgi:hypothetical protein
MTKQTFSKHLKKRPQLKKAYIKELEELREKFIKLIRDNPLPNGRPKKLTKISFYLLDKK